MASQIEMFALSKREIEEKFTKSEMTLLAWRSQEMSYQMKNQSDSDSGERVSNKKKRKEGTPHWVPDHLINEEGELDLRLATGKEAHKFFAMQGIQLPVIISNRLAEG